MARSGVGHEWADPKGALPVERVHMSRHDWFAKHREDRDQAQAVRHQDVLGSERQASFSARRAEKSREEDQCL